MVLQRSLLGKDIEPERRFLSLFLPNWATDYLKRRDPRLTAPLALYEKIKGGLRIAAIDEAAAANGVRLGQSAADARALLPRLEMREIDRPLLENGFADFADWHSNVSPLVSVMKDKVLFGDLLIDVTGVAHLFGGEQIMLGMVVERVQRLGYAASGAIAPTIGAAWAISHFARSQVVTIDSFADLLDTLPIGALRLDAEPIAALTQMGLLTIGQLRSRARKPMQARFGASLLVRLDQAFGQIEERMTPRLPVIDHFAEQRFFEPISLLDDVLGTVKKLALELSANLESKALGAQTFHLFVYRIDHKVMTLSLNAARLTRDPHHISELFRHRAQKLEAEDYDPGFGIDLVRLAASSLDALEAIQDGAFETENGAEDIDRLTDRLGSRLGSTAVLKISLRESTIPERAIRLVPAMVAETQTLPSYPRPGRPVRLLPMPESVKINAEVPNGLPASMIWRGQHYRLVKGAGPERLSAEWWRTRTHLKLVEPPEEEFKPDQKSKLPPYIPDLPLYDPDAGTRDYFLVEDNSGQRFWVFRKGFYDGDTPAAWYLHGFFS